MTYTATDKIARQATVAVIERLDAVGVGIQDLPGGTPPTNPTGLPLITAKAQPAKPDRIIAVTCYATLDNPQLSDTVLRVQLWGRGAPNDPFDADDILDAAFPHLHKVRHAVWNGLEIAAMVRISTAPMGPDGSGRYSRSDNYEIVTQRRESP